ncbi:MAG: VIT domain-containing protein [Nitrospirota bacterium]|nr:VIT domain-containing protein [Nitrospirota bacterium]
MRTVTRLFAVLALAVFLLAGTTGRAQQPEPDDKTLSPYFLVNSSDPDTDRLPLRSTFADVKIAGVIADVSVTQVYKNEGRYIIEAIYVFPASTRAAVYALKMTVGKRTIIAKIRKRDEARQEYEQARQQGRSASLLEQQRPNVFQMNVANILPGDEIRVEMNYTELLLPTDREYEFLYPTVVGPRYSNQPAAAAPAAEQWVKNPYLHQGVSPTYSFGVQVTLAAGMPIQQIASPSHKVDIRYSGNTRATVTLDSSEHSGGNRDYILKYRLAGGRIESGLLLTEGDKENFFLLMLQPPRRVTLEQIPGREYIFIVDVSGSMHGFPLDISKKLLKDLINNLRATDTFNVLLFAGGSSLLSERSLTATPENISKAVNAIEHQQGGGGTELLPALKRALSLPRSEHFSRSVIIATDGYVSVEAEAFDLIRNSLGTANMFAFGIGTSVNRHLIEGMARAGMGEPFVITKPEEAPAKAEAFRTLVQSPVLTGIDLDFGDFDVYDTEPRSIPDVLADRPVILFGKWRGRPEGTVTIKGISGEGEYRDTFDVSTVKPLRANAALRYLWARNRIAMLSDYNQLRPDDQRIREVVELGLQYNLLTNYTSFVATDSEIRSRDGRTTTVKQPLPLPQGVSDHALGGSASAVSPAPIMRLQKSRTAEEAAPANGLLKDKAEKKDRTVDVRIVTVAASGGLSEDIVRSSLERQMRSLQGCFAAVQPAVGITLKLLIDRSGAVTSVEVPQSRITDKAVLDCLRRTILGWTFRSSAEGRETEAVIALRIN